MVRLVNGVSVAFFSKNAAIILIGPLVVVIFQYAMVATQAVRIAYTLRTNMRCSARWYCCGHNMPQNFLPCGQPLPRAACGGHVLRTAHGMQQSDPQFLLFLHLFLLCSMLANEAQ